MERICSFLDVEAHRINHAKRPLKRCRNRSPLADIDTNAPKLRVIATRSFRMPGADANREPLVPQVTHRAASQEASAAQHGYDIAHGIPIRDYAASCSKTRSTLAAMMKSFSCSPLTFFVCRETVA